MRSLAFVTLALLGCATVQRSAIRADYDQSDRDKTLRLVVVTAPLPDAQPALGELWSLIARRYVNQHRDFIVHRHLAAQAPPADACGERTQGVLVMHPRVRRQAREVEAAVQARLIRCPDGERIWEAVAGGTWPESDSTVKELTARYVEELGERVRPYVAATFHLLRATLDTLPRPRLVRDEDVMEKVELGE